MYHTHIHLLQLLFPFALSALMSFLSTFSTAQMRHQIIQSAVTYFNWQFGSHINFCFNYKQNVLIIFFHCFRFCLLNQLVSTVSVF